MGERRAPYAPEYRCQMVELVDTPSLVGRAKEGRAVVLQHHQKHPVSLTLTQLEEGGTLSHRACGERGTPFLECHAGVLESD